jgi:hypothetical protein
VSRLFSAVLGLVYLPAIGCRSQQAQIAPSIEFTRLPPAGEGSQYLLRPIAGRVTGASPNQRVVLFARAGVWWLQPLGVDHPFTTIRGDSTWNNSTHPGTAYAALLVDAGYKPPLTLDALPEKGGPVLAVVTAEGSKLDQGSIKKLDFSGYEWLVRETEGSPAGSRNQYESANAWVDEKGFLHLRIRETPAGWTSAEVRLVPSLGYGSYRFLVSDVSRLEPPVVLAISNGSGPTREMDIEISRWGALVGKNSQYVVQPFDVAANVVRFLSPPGRLTYSFDWEPGRIGFRTVRGAGTRREEGGNADLIAAHMFTSGVPSPGSETLHLNFYIFGTQGVRIQHGAEVTIEKFEYLP